MGYTSDPRWRSPADVGHAILNDTELGEGLVISQAMPLTKLIGYTKLWLVCHERPVDAVRPEPFILLVLIQRCGAAYGYKVIDETCGPNEVDCPLSFLKVCPDPRAGYSTDWRERVKTYWLEKGVRYA